MEAQFSIVIFEAFQSVVKNPNLLQVITIVFLFSNPLYVTTYKSSAIDHRMSQFFCQFSALSMRPIVRAYRPRLPVRAYTLSPCPNFVRALLSAPRDSTHSRTMCGSSPKLSVPMPVPACAHNCSSWRSTRFHRQPLHIANHHIGRQQ